MIVKSERGRKKQDKINLCKSKFCGNCKHCVENCWRTPTCIECMQSGEKVNFEYGRHLSSQLENYSINPQHRARLGTPLKLKY